MGEDWERLTAAYAATRVPRDGLRRHQRRRTTGIDDSYAAAFFEGIGSEIMGAAMFGTSPTIRTGRLVGRPAAVPPPILLTHTAPRRRSRCRATTFHFRSDAIKEVLAEATEAAGGRTYASAGDQHRA
jgi:hypothetical protein